MWGQRKTKGIIKDNKIKKNLKSTANLIEKYRLMQTTFFAPAATATLHPAYMRQLFFFIILKEK